MIQSQLMCIETSESSNFKHQVNVHVSMCSLSVCVFLLHLLPRCTENDDSVASTLSSTFSLCTRDSLPYSCAEHAPSAVMLGGDLHSVPCLRLLWLPAVCVDDPNLSANINCLASGSETVRSVIPFENCWLQSSTAHYQVSLHFREQMVCHANYGIIVAVSIITRSFFLQHPV